MARKKNKTTTNRRSSIWKRVVNVLPPEKTLIKFISTHNGFSEWIGYYNSQKEYFYGAISYTEAFPDIIERKYVKQWAELHSSLLEKNDE